MTEKLHFKKREEELVTGLKELYDEKQSLKESYTEKRFTVLYGIDENPFEWDLMDNQKDCLIVQGNGTAICELLNELNNENKKLKAEVIEWKSKYFDAMDTVINEYSTNIGKDMEELEKEVWGDCE